MEVNHLADRTDSEMKMIRGFRRTKNYDGILGLPFDMTEFKGVTAPSFWDWRLYGT
jgi:hypothetical protein